MKIYRSTNILPHLFLVEVSMNIDGKHITINKGDNGIIRFVFSHKRKKIGVGQRNFRFIIKKNKEDYDTSAIFDETKQGGNIDDNFICFNLSSTVTNNQTGSYFWALRVIDSGHVETIQEGMFTIDRGTYYGEN